MFAVPDYTVPPTSPSPPLSAPALVRRVSSASWRDLLSDRAGRLALPYDDPRVRVWLDVLPAGTVEAAHRYDAAQGAFAVLSGEVEERAGGTARRLRPGQVRVFGPGYRHTVRNAGAEPAVTLHVQIDANRAAGAA